MYSRLIKKAIIKKPSVGRRALVGANMTAIIIAAVLIFLSRVAQPAELSELPPSYQVLASGTSLGLANAPVTIIVFTDYQCNVCQTFALTTEKKIMKAYVETGKVRLVFKHFVVYGEESMQAAMASEAAAEQNKFWEYHDLLMKMRFSSKVEDVTTAKLQNLAEQAGLDMEAFNASFLSEKYREKVVQDCNEGKALDVRGAPTFFVDGRKGQGDVSFASFQNTIEALLEESKTE